MPPCPTRLTLSEQFALLRQTRACRLMGRGAVAAALGLLLVRPSSLHHDPLGSPETLPGLHPPDVALLAATAEPEDTACPDVEADLSTVDMGPDAGMSRPRYRMPTSEDGMPKGWRRTPCPKGEGVRIVHNVCFDALKETPSGVPPTCDRGIPYSGECLQPMAAVQKLPNTIGR